MVHIKIKKGLDIPIKGKPEGNLKPLVPGGEASPLISPAQIALELSEFEDLKFKLFVKIGDVVKVGQPLAEDKSTPGRMFVSPAGGVVKDIRRGAKRVLTAIVIDVAKNEEWIEFPPIDSNHASRDEILERMKMGGIFGSIRSRPFNILADPTKKPRSIFVKALESAPFMPPAEMQVQGHEAEFQIGLNALSKLTDGLVHLVYAKNTTCKAFLDAKNVEKHTAEGPHPIGNYSVHIQKIDRIASSDAIVWTINAHDVAALGHLLKGRCMIEKVISIAGPGILSDRTGYFQGRSGYPIGGLIAGRIKKGAVRLISGTPLTGHKVNVEDFLGFDDYVFSAIPENVKREFLHFFGLGLNKYSFSKAYVSGHLNHREREYDFTTSQHGEHRAFIDSSLYDKVMPLEIPTMMLVKAVIAEDYELAEAYGLLEVASEDFALPTFVCPSKMEMTEIIKKGLKQYAKEVLQ
jgi:Na+-transporting NADH:ubiquinone oxidoreductase subunit A